MTYCDNTDLPVDMCAHCLPVPAPALKFYTTTYGITITISDSSGSDWTEEETIALLETVGHPDTTEVKRTRGYKLHADKFNRSVNAARMKYERLNGEHFARNANNAK